MIIDSKRETDFSKITNDESGIFISIKNKLLHISQFTLLKHLVYDSVYKIVDKIVCF